MCSGALDSALQFEDWASTSRCIYGVIYVIDDSLDGIMKVRWSNVCNCDYSILREAATSMTHGFTILSWSRNIIRGSRMEFNQVVELRTAVTSIFLKAYSHIVFPHLPATNN